MRIVNYLLFSICLFFAPIQGLLVAVGTSIVLDTITGIYKSIKRKGWKSIKSRRLSNIVSKMFLYEICILCLFAIDKLLLNELISIHFTIEYFFTKTCAILLILIELTSIKENIEEAFGVNLWSLLKELFKRAKEVKDDFNEIKD